MVKRSGFLLVLSGPSGAGKNTVLNATMQLRNDLVYSVSATSRPRRPHEQDGVDYFFLTPEEFERRIRTNEFLEWAEYCGYRYGTPRSFVEKSLQDGYVVVMDVDIQGARQIKERMPNAIFVFLLPPTLDELESRLRGRRTDSDDAISRRLQAANDELRAGVDYDYAIVNNKVEDAAAQLSAIITAEKCRIHRTEYFSLMSEIIGKEVNTI